MTRRGFEVNIKRENGRTKPRTMVKVKKISCFYSHKKLPKSECERNVKITKKTSDLIFFKANFYLILVFLSFICVHGAPQVSSSDSGVKHVLQHAIYKNGPPYTQQGMQSILIAIEDRLRSLDSAWDKARTGMEEQLVRAATKLELLETKIDRMEGAVGARLEALATRLEAQSERSLHIQLATERAAKSCERLHHRLEIQPSLSHVEARLRKLEDTSDMRRTHTVMQQDASGASELRAALVKEANAIGIKMYNELWRRSQSLESLVKDSMALTNATRRETQDGVRSITLQLARKGMPVQPSNPQYCSEDSIISSFSNLLHRKLLESNRKMESKFEDVIRAQNLFLESCHRIQYNEAQIESQITAVLEKLVDSFKNKTSSTFNELQAIQESVKSHDTHIIRAVARVNNAALMASKHHKEVAEAIEDIRDQIMGEESYASGHVEKRLDGMMSSIQKLHDDVSNPKGQKGNKQLISEVIEATLKAMSENQTGMCGANFAEDNELFISKLSYLIENLENSIKHLDERDEYFDRENADDISDEANKIKNNQTAYNMTAEELIRKLKHIQYEDSLEYSKFNDVDTENSVFSEEKGRSLPKLRHSKENVNKVKEFDDKNGSNGSGKDDISIEDYDDDEYPDS